MNNAKRNNHKRRGALYTTGKNLTLVAGWAVVAGMIFTTHAKAEDQARDAASPGSTEVSSPTPGALAAGSPGEQSPGAAPTPQTIAPAVSPGSETSAPAVTPGKQAADPAPVVAQPFVIEAPATQPTTLPSLPAAAPSHTEGEPLVTTGLGAHGEINLMVNKGMVVMTRVPYKRVSIAQPEVADVNLVGPSEVLLTAKRPGSTQLILWDDLDHSQVIDVIVSSDLAGLTAQLQTMFPKAAIKIENANGTIVLRGHVPDLTTAQQAVSFVTPYASTRNVLNFLEVSGGQQVVLQVRFAEVSRSVTDGLGFNAFATDGKFSLGLGNGAAGAAPTVPNAATVGTANGTGAIPIYGGAAFGNSTFEYFVQALRQNSLLRILAEPNLTAISGQQASFLAGGEFPIPVPQTSGGGTAITIEYKKYGIELNFTPTVLGDGRMRLQCTPSVSELDYTNAVSLDGYTIPGLTTRNVSTTVELAEGQTFALAGLLQDQVKASKNITPLLGDLPILGALFRSVNYQRSETELVVLVTPRLVEALNPNQVPALPGNPWREPTEAQLFLNMDLGGPAPDTRHAPAVRSSLFYGPAGFNPAPGAAPTPQK